MIVYYVEPEYASPSDRTYARTLADAHAIAKSMHRREPAIVRALVDTNAEGIVAMLNGEFTPMKLAAWTLTSRGGLQPTNLEEV